MKIKEILKLVGLNSQEIKTRLANKQIKINGEDVDQTVDFDIDSSVKPIDLGDFIFNHIDLFHNNPISILFTGQMPLAFGEHNISPKTEQTIALDNLLKKHICISISKKQHFVLAKS